MNDTVIGEPKWRPLYRVGGLAAFITSIILPVQVSVFLLWPPPVTGTVVDWFLLFRINWLLGLLGLDLLYIIDYILLIPIVLALYIALRRLNESWMLLGSIIFFVAIAAYFASTIAFEMLSLSNQFFSVASDIQRVTLLSAGQIMFETYKGTAFHINFFLGSLAGIIVSSVMLKSRAFGKVAGFSGIFGNLVGLGLYIPRIGILLSLLSVISLWIWYILVTRGLLQLGRSRKEVKNIIPNQKFF